MWPATRLPCRKLQGTEAVCVPIGRIMSTCPGCAAIESGAMPAHFRFPTVCRDAMTLTCSREHFEGDRDTAFLREADACSWRLKGGCVSFRSISQAPIIFEATLLLGMAGLLFDDQAVAPLPALDTRMCAMPANTMWHTFVLASGFTARGIGDGTLRDRQCCRCRSCPAISGMPSYSGRLKGVQFLEDVCDGRIDFRPLLSWGNLRTRGAGRRMGFGRIRPRQANRDCAVDGAPHACCCRPISV